ncbi:MAG: hypothetical protein RL304_995 [Verrucomicrobiota bacterium]
MKHQLLGKKIGMTQVYDGENNLVPVTVVQAGPCPVTQVKTKATDGYNAVQIAFGAQKESRLSAGEVGHLRKAGVAPHSHLHEIRLADDAKGDVAKVGDVITVEKFTAGQMVDVVGTVKGRGFQGVVKRHNMDGQPDSHGHMMHRRIGSIGMRQTPGHASCRCSPRRTSSSSRAASPAPTARSSSSARPRRPSPPSNPSSTSAL